MENELESSPEAIHQLQRSKSAITASVLKNRRPSFRTVADLDHQDPPLQGSNTRDPLDTHPNVPSTPEPPPPSPSEYFSCDENDGNCLSHLEHGRLWCAPQYCVLFNARNIRGKTFGATFERIFAIINFILEASTAVFDQLSSPHRPYFALIGMLTSFTALIACIGELVCKCRKGGVTWKRKGRIYWFYHPSPDAVCFGSFPDVIGFTCGIFQCISTTIAYTYLRHHHTNPIKISIWPVVFAFCLLCSKFLENMGTSTPVHIQES